MDVSKFIAVIIGIILCAGVVRIALIVISKKLKKNYGIEFGIGSFGFFVIKDVWIRKKDNVVIRIDRIALVSRLLNWDSPKLFNIVIDKLESTIEEENELTQEVVVSRKATDSPSKSASQPSIVLQSALYIIQYIGIIIHEVLLNASKSGLKIACKSKVSVKAEYKLAENSQRMLSLSIHVDDTVMKVSEGSKPILDCSLILVVCTSITPTHASKLTDVHIRLSRLTLTCREGMMKRATKQRRGRQPVSVTESAGATETTESSMEQGLVQKLQLLPKIAVVSLEDCKLVYVSSKGRELALRWHCDVSWKCSSQDAGPDVQCLAYNLSVDLTGLALSSSCNKILLNKQIECAVKFAPSTRTGSVQLNFDTLHSSIIQEELEYWLEESRNYLPLPENDSLQLLQETKPSTSSNKVAVMPLDNWSVRLMLRNCSCDVNGISKETDQSYPILNAYLGEFEIDVVGFNQDETHFTSLRANLLVSDFYTYINQLKSDCTGELLRDECADKPAVLPSSERHVWGRLFELGKISVEVSSDKVLFDRTVPLVLTASGQVSYVASELAMPVALAAKELYCMVERLGVISQRKLVPVQQRTSSLQCEDSSGTLKVHIDVEMRVRNCNMFLLGDRPDGLNSLLLRLDHVDISTGSKDEPMLWEVNDLRLSRMCGTTKNEPYKCLGQNVAKQWLVYVPSISTCFFRKKQPKSLTVSIPDCSLEWDSARHMVIYEQLLGFSEAKDVLSVLVQRVPHNKGELKTDQSQMDVKIDVISATLKMKTSQRNSFGIKMDNFSLRSSQTEKFVKASQVEMLFDENLILKQQEAELRASPGDVLRGTREKHAGLSPQNDRALSFEVERCQIVFPYRFDFASSLESLLSIFKMLKKLHKKKKADGYDEPLPADLRIVFSVLTLELEDDPFEVKLEQNYLLQLDEMEECLERKRKLKERLNDIHGTFLSTKKMEEIMKNLAEKNAQIYIKRSMAIHQDDGKRSTLFKCAVRDLDLMVMADSSFHGKEKVIENLKAVDDASPFPQELQFSTLWCRMVDGKFKCLTMTIRDYQQPLVCVESFHVSGRLIGAEQVGDDISTRESIVEIEDPWPDMVVTKNMPSLKFYHDLNWGMEFFEIGWGINFEPAWATVSLGFELLSKASVDPSKPLPFWDKMRLLFHGTLKMNIDKFNIVLSASRDPNNTTEKMVMAWEDFFFYWTNACIIIKGDFDLHIRTASKYDDSRVLHFPNLEVRFDLEWLCLGDPNDHHRAVPSNPEKILDLENHDSFRNLRSKNLNLSVNFETGKNFGKEQLKTNPPTLFLYASTFKWFQKYQAVVLNNVSRPIRRGSYFGNIKPRKPTLGRHFKFLNIDFTFNRLCVNYFGSFTQDAGFHMVVSSGNFSANYEVDVRRVHDGSCLIRRPVANWILRGLQSELEKVSTDLVSNLAESEDFLQKEISEDFIDIERKTKSYFLFSVKRVIYRRKLPGSDMSSYIHKVRLNDFRGAWTAFNRKITFELFEAYENMQMLKRVLSSEALKHTKDNNSQDFRRHHKDSFIDIATASYKVNQEHDNRLLQQLVLEQDSKFLAQVEEGDSECEGQQKSTEEDDVIQLNWHIELVNSQVMLIGRENNGALLITAANADIMKKLHRPVGTNDDVILKLNKVTWNGKLNNLQCFATSMNMIDLSSTSIPWVNSSIIGGMPTNAQADSQSNVAQFMKSSYCIGSIVNVSFGGSTIELQRVVSPSHCEFKYVSLDPELDPYAEDFELSQCTSSLPGASLSPQANLANTLLIRHPSLEISTSPDQYAMIMEICQTLLLYTEPKKREKEDRFEKMKFRMQLSTGEDTKGDIQELQNRVRDSLSYLRRCERQLFDCRRKVASNICTDDDSCLNMALELREAVVDLQDQIMVTKEQLNADSEELKMMIWIYKDFTLNSASPSPTKGRNKNYIIKQSDIIFDDMRWRLTQQDGQLGIADVQFKKFHYNKLTFNDNGVEHRLELGGFSVFNLIPNEPYRELFVPHEVNVRRHFDKSVFVRVYCRVQSPVAGISVKEHFEVNVCPIAVRLTHRFYHYISSFFFSRKAEKMDQVDGPELEFGNKGKDEGEESQVDQAQSLQSFKKPPPPRPPPPKLVQTPKQQLPMTSPVKQSPMNQPTYLDLQAEERLKKKPGLTLSLPSQKESASTPSPSPVSSAGTPARTPSIKKSASFYSGFSTDENIDKMKQRAAKNQTFIYIKIPKIPICFSYKGEKERNIEDAHDFNLCLPTLEYHNKTWTWQDLSMALKKDYTQVLVPQIIKEKLHLKGDWDSKKSLAKVGDDEKTKMLLGDLPGTHKKTGKKLLFGKLTSLVTKESAENEAKKKVVRQEKSAELSGKGVDPVELKDELDRIRNVSTEHLNKEK